MFDVDVYACESSKDARSVVQVLARPAGVVVLQVDSELLGPTDQLELRDVGAARGGRVGHENILAARPWRLAAHAHLPSNECPGPFHGLVALVDEPRKRLKDMRHLRDYVENH